MVGYAFVQQVISFLSEQLFHQVQPSRQPLSLTTTPTFSLSLQDPIQVNQIIRSRHRNRYRAERGRTRLRIEKRRATNEIKGRKARIGEPWNH